jgi:DNA-binding transcriptional LysR family regulator
MELKHLRYYLAVAEQLSFARAADNLHIAQTGLSQRIMALEREFGLRLFDRSRSHVRLTPAGEALRADIERIVHDADHLVARAAALAAGERGIVRLAHTRSASSGLPTRLVAEFRRRHPEMTLEVAAGSTEDNLPRLRRRELDVAFVRPPFDTEPALACLTLAYEPLVLIVPERHRLARGRRIARTDLLEEPLVSFPRENGPRFYDHMMDQVYGADRRPPIAAVEPDIEYTIAAAAEGVGVAIVGAAMAEALRPTGVVVRQFVAPQPVMPIAVAWNTNAVSAGLDTFLEFVRWRSGEADAIASAG